MVFRRETDTCRLALSRRSNLLDRLSCHPGRLEIRDVLELDAACTDYRRFYNTVRPHEALAFAVLLSRYVIEPDWPR
jgi:hypothetical protein